MRQTEIPANMMTQDQAAIIIQQLRIAPNGSAHQENQGWVQKNFGKIIDVTKILEVVGNCKKKRATPEEPTTFANVRTLIMISIWNWKYGIVSGISLRLYSSAKLSFGL